MKYKKSSGFLLLEMAIFLSVIGILSAVLAKNSIAYAKFRNNKFLKENLETVKCALVDFLAANYRLPSPSNFDGNGIEGDEKNACGYIPYKALGIPYERTKDCNGKSLFYVVEPALTDRKISRIQLEDEGFEIATNDCFCKTYSPAIKITNQNSDVLVDDQSKVAFVITDTQPIKNSNYIHIKATQNTEWFTRGVLLTKYLKMKPCLPPSFSEYKNKNSNQLQKPTKVSPIDDLL